MIDEQINNNRSLENEGQEIDLVALLFKYLFIGVGLLLVY